MKNIKMNIMSESIPFRLKGFEGKRFCLLARCECGLWRRTKSGVWTFVCVTKNVRYGTQARARNHRDLLHVFLLLQLVRTIPLPYSTPSFPISWYAPGRRKSSRGKCSRCDLLLVGDWSSWNVATMTMIPKSIMIGSNCKRFLSSSRWSTHT